jgi:hypothetical protein
MTEAKMEVEKRELRLEKEIEPQSGSPLRRNLEITVAGNSKANLPTRKK